MYYSIAEVKGSGNFPVDMLRYDGCYPHRSEDAIEIGISIGVREAKRPGEGYSVQVSRQRKTKAEAENWTVGRWASFGWTLKVLRGGRF